MTMLPAASAIDSSRAACNKRSTFLSEYESVDSRFPAGPRDRDRPALVAEQNDRPPPPGAVPAHQPAQRRLLVRRVSGNMHVREADQLCDREVDEPLECEPSPASRGPTSAVLAAHVDHAEEILERHIAREARRPSMSKKRSPGDGSAARTDRARTFPRVEQLVSRDTVGVRDRVLQCRRAWRSRKLVMLMRAGGRRRGTTPRAVMVVIPADANATT